MGRPHVHPYRMLSLQKRGLHEEIRRPTRSQPMYPKPLIKQNVQTY